GSVLRSLPPYRRLSHERLQAMPSGQEGMTMRPWNFVIAVIATMAVLSATVIHESLPQLYAADAEEAWKKDFDDICGRTDDAAALSVDDIKKLIGRCDELQKVIEGLDGSTKMVYLKRLKMCRDLFSYLLTVKESEKRE
ncbi:MAG: hypothetical protein ACM3ON_07650, partial [Chloroflexota bacterium]